LRPYGSCIISDDLWDNEYVDTDVVYIVLFQMAYGTMVLCLALVAARLTM